MNLQLFYCAICPPCRAVLSVIKTLNLPVRLKEVDILSYGNLPLELKKINPQHNIPTLIDDDFVIWDSHAIAIYLVEKYGKNRLLYPECRYTKAMIHQRLHFDSGVLYPLLYNSAAPILFRGKIGISSVHMSGIKRAYDILEYFLVKNPFLVGSSLTIADLCCVPTITSLDYMLPISRRQTPNLFKYIECFQNYFLHQDINQAGLEQMGRKLQEKLIVSLRKMQKNSVDTI